MKLQFIQTLRAFRRAGTLLHVSPRPAKTTWRFTSNHNVFLNNQGRKHFLQCYAYGTRSQCHINRLVNFWIVALQSCFHAVLQFSCLAASFQSFFTMFLSGRVVLMLFSEKLPKSLKQHSGTIQNWSKIKLINARSNKRGRPLKMATSSLPRPLEYDSPKKP